MKIRWSWHCLIIKMGLVRHHHYIETAPSNVEKSYHRNSAFLDSTLESTKDKLHISLSGNLYGVFLWVALIV